MPKQKGTSAEDRSKANLKRYARLIWRIFKRIEDEKETEISSSLKDEWGKRFKDEQ